LLFIVPNSQLFPVSKITSLKKLLFIIHNLSSITKTVVLATGVFDLLHSEHRKFLKKAKEQGEILLVGVETDARVRKLKGLGRPVWDLAKRLKEISKPAFVDFAFPLPEKFDKPEDHEKLIAQLKPDILAVSASTPNLKAKKKLIEKYGGKLKVVLPYNPKVSTTKIISSLFPAASGKQ